MATQKRRKRHQYSLVDAQLATITKSDELVEGQTNPRSDMYVNSTNSDVPMHHIKSWQGDDLKYTQRNMQRPEASEHKASGTPATLAINLESHRNESAYITVGWRTIGCYAIQWIQPVQDDTSKAPSCNHKSNIRSIRPNTSDWADDVRRKATDHFRVMVAHHSVAQASTNTTHIRPPCSSKRRKMQPRSQCNATKTCQMHQSEPALRPQRRYHEARCDDPIQSMHNCMHACL